VWRLPAAGVNKLVPIWYVYFRRETLLSRAKSPAVRARPVLAPKLVDCAPRERSDSLTKEVGELAQAFVIAACNPYMQLVTFVH
jgi:hypothetical protein